MKIIGSKIGQWIRYSRL